jgi:hypothetical protein
MRYCVYRKLSSPIPGVAARAEVHPSRTTRRSSSHQHALSPSSLFPSQLSGTSFVRTISCTALNSPYIPQMSQEQPAASTSAAVVETPADERQIAIRLTTKDTAYSIPSTKFLVPSSWRRFHLSELINKVLENCEHPPRPCFALRLNALLSASLADSVRLSYQLVSPSLFTRRLLLFDGHERGSNPRNRIPSVDSSSSTRIDSSERRLGQRCLGSGQRVRDTVFGD